MPPPPVTGSQCFGGQNLSYFGTPQAPKVLDYLPPFYSHVDPTLLCFERGG